MSAASAFSDIGGRAMSHNGRKGDIQSCACKPGSRDDGWQEKRSESCIRREMDAWSRVIAGHRNGTYLSEADR